MSTVAHYGETALTLDPDTTWDQWVEAGHTLGYMAKKLPWLVGDWLLFGEDKFGEKAAQMMDELGYSYSTLANVTSVARRVPPPRRRADLPWAHHAEVAKLDPQDQTGFLALAVKQGWTKQQLREAVKLGGQPSEHPLCPTCGRKMP